MEQLDDFPRIAGLRGQVGGEGGQPGDGLGGRVDLPFIDGLHVVQGVFQHLGEERAVTGLPPESRAHPVCCIHERFLSLWRFVLRVIRRSRKHHSHPGR